MKDFDPATSFGPRVAAEYDAQPRGDEAAAVAFLEVLAGGRPALEFAIGTGRIAVPLAERGVRVDGIELSPAMVEQLRTKPHGEGLNVAIGDMSETQTGQRYGLVYLVFNTIFNLLTADAQIRCFENAAHHLEPGGHFVVEAAMPHAWIRPGRRDFVQVEHVGMEAVGLDVARYDPVTQHLHESHLRFTENGTRMTPLLLRLITPSEMDLMARIAGLELVERLAGWERAPFTADSLAHVSVYGLPA